VRGEEVTVFSPTTTDPSTIVTDPQTSYGQALIIFFWREDGSNVLTTEGLAHMREVEQWVRNRNGFEDVCLRNEDGVCFEANSLTQFVYVTHAVEPVLRPPRMHTATPK
jgi:hypothetical protein